MVGLGGIQSGKHLRLNFLEAGQRLGGGCSGTTRAGFDQRDGVTHLGRLQLANARNDVTHLARFQGVARLVGRREHAHVVGVVGGASGHHLDALAFAQAPIDHPHQHDDAHVVVKPAVNDHGAQRTIGIALGRRHAGHHRLQNFINAHACFGRAGNGVRGVNANDVFNFQFGVVGVSVGQIHLVQDRHHLHTQLQRGVAVGHRLRFHALTGIHHQQRTFTSRKGAAHLVGEVHMPGRIDQIEVIGLAIERLVLERRRLGLDGDPALFLDVHRVQHLGFHLARLETATALDQAVGQGGLAMINVRNDRKISDVIHQRGHLSD